MLNVPYPAEEVWDRLPWEVQEEVIAKGLAASPGAAVGKVYFTADDGTLEEVAAEESGERRPGVAYGVGAVAGVPEGGPPGRGLSAHTNTTTSA